MSKIESYVKHGTWYLPICKAFSEFKSIDNGCETTIYAFAAHLYQVSGPWCLLFRRRFQVGAIDEYMKVRQMGASTWPAVCPSWDNTARKMERAHSWIHSCLENYLTWLQEVVTFLRKDRPPGKRILLINAWNKKGEGCHLEPDEKNGYAWLNATRQAPCLESGSNVIQYNQSKPFLI
jgi:hypothetical protein